MSDEEKKCGTCGAVATIKEQDAFYSCAECWLKVHSKKEKQKK
jgi:predicted RNA-binding Zn-ribbon protein involved in translation (DUF1610 family)